MNRYRIRGLVVAETAMHVRAALAPGAVSENPIARDAWGRAIIPGATLKGAMRGAVERIVPSLALPGVTSCGLSSGSQNDCPSVNDEQRRAAQALPDDAARAAFLDQHLCSTCALFGSPLRKGRLAFADLLPPAGWPDQAELREGAPINRDTERAQERRRYDIEVLPGGTPFDCTIVGEDLADTDLALFSLCLLELIHGHLVLGGGKTRGLGRCHLELQAVERVRFDPEHRAELLTYLRDGTMQPVGASALDFLAERVDALLTA